MQWPAAGSCELLATPGAAPKQEELLSTRSLDVFHALKAWMVPRMHFCRGGWQVHQSRPVTHAEMVVGMRANDASSQAKALRFSFRPPLNSLPLSVNKTGAAEVSKPPPCEARTHTHTRAHARTHARTHTRTHARTHAHTHTHRLGETELVSGCSYDDKLAGPSLIAIVLHGVCLLPRSSKGHTPFH